MPSMAITGLYILRIGDMLVFIIYDDGLSRGTSGKELILLCTNFIC